MDKEFDVFGIGSPLIDIFLEVDDTHLLELELEKGRMHPIDHEKLSDIQNKFKNPKKTQVAGDIPNVLMGIAAMGGRSVFCGKVGKDGYGNMFEEMLISDKIKPVLARCDKSYTGQVVAFITKDAQRTFITHFGAAVGLKKEEAVFDDLKKSRFLYTSAYVLYTTDLKETVLHTLEIAKKSDVKIAFDLADVGAINLHREEINKIIKDYVNVLFANEEEAKELTGKEPKEALGALSKMCEIAVVKLGEKGSLIKRNDEVVDFKIEKEKAVDSTGAGDMYAAGFLFALTKTDDLELCAKVASYASAKIVQQFGARLEEQVQDKVEAILEGKTPNYEK